MNHWHRPNRIKTCISCGKSKLIAEFYSYAYTRNDGKPGTRFDSKCKGCARQKSKERSKEVAKANAARRQVERSTADIRDYLEYEPSTGIFRWKRLPKGAIGKARLGQIAGNLTHGYREITFLGKTYRAHDLVWLFTHEIGRASCRERV